jgi:hypothetical protein
MKTRVNLQNVLSAAAIAIAGVALLRGNLNLDAASTAVAEPPPARFSAGEQRIEMIGELRALNARMARIEAALNGGLTVRVIESEAEAQN